MSIPLGLALSPEIERPLDLRSVCTSNERPEYMYNGQLVYETDTQQYVYFNGENWVRLFDAIQTDPFVQGLVQGVTADLTEIHRRLNDSFPDVYRRLEHIEEDNLAGIYQTLDFLDARGRQMKDRLEELENLIVNIEQRNEQLHHRIESFIGRLNAVEDAHNNNPHNGDTNDDNTNDNTNDDTNDPPLALV